MTPKVDIQIQKTRNKPLEAENSAATAKYARDRVVNILAKISSEDRAKKMIGLAKEAAENAKTAAAETERFAAEAQFIVKALQSTLESLKGRTAHLVKGKMECKISSVTDLVQDARASEDSAEMFAEKAADFAIEAERCAAFVSMVARDPQRGFDVKIRSINPIVSNMLEYNLKPLKIRAGQRVTLNLEYVVFGWPQVEVRVGIDPIVMIGNQPMPLDSIKRTVRFGKEENRKIFRDILNFSIPYPTLSQERESFHDLHLDMRINGKISDAEIVKHAFGVLGPGTDFNGSVNLGICVLRSDKDMTLNAYGGTKRNKPYNGKVEMTLQPLSRHGASLRKVLENECFIPRIVFKKFPLGRYRVAAVVQGDKGLKGARSGSNLVTFFKPHPQAEYSAHSFFSIAIQLGKSRGEKRPSFAKPRKHKKPEKPLGPEAWYVQIKVEDMKGKEISGARVFTSDGAMTAGEQGGGKYLLGPIRNVKNVSEKAIEVVADITFKSAHPTWLGHKKPISVVLRDKAYVEVTIRFDDYEEDKTGLAGVSGGGRSSTPSWVPKKAGDSKRKDTTGDSRPSWAGGHKGGDSSGGTVTKGDEGKSKVAGSGEGQTANKRSREECEHKLCKECYFMGQRIDRSELPAGGVDPCKECLRNKAGLIKQCMEGKS